MLITSTGMGTLNSQGTYNENVDGQMKRGAARAHTHTHTPSFSPKEPKILPSVIGIS